MRGAALVMGALGSLSAWCVAGGPPDFPQHTQAERQLAFAEELRKSGEGQLAIPEYRRFVFIFPHDPHVPDARLAIARGHLEHTGDVAAARRELTALAEQHPNTPAAERGEELDALIEANKELGYKPLLLYFGARGAGRRPLPAIGQAGGHRELDARPAARLQHRARAFARQASRSVRRPPALDSSLRFPVARPPVATCLL